LAVISNITIVVFITAFVLTAFDTIVHDKLEPCNAVCADLLVVRALGAVQVARSLVSLTAALVVLALDAFGTDKLVSLKTGLTGVLSV